MQTGESLPTVSVVIPTYERRHLLPAMLPPLLGDDATTELIVVVDGSHDGSYEYLEGLARDEPRLRPVFVENGGEAAARQLGAELAAGEVLVILDDDVRAEPGLVNGHARRQRELEHTVVVGSMPVDLAVLPRRGHLPEYLYALEYERECERFTHDPDYVLHGLWCGNISMRRDDVCRAGLDAPGDHRYDYNEDRAFGLRCIRAGLRGVFDPSLRAKHLYTRSFEQFLADARKQGVSGVWMHREYADLLGPLDVDADEEGLGPAFRLPARLGRVRVVRAVEIPALEAVCALAGAVHLWRVERLAAVVLRRIVQRAAMIDELDRIGDIRFPRDLGT